jgi:hypothetical protein
VAFGGFGVLLKRTGVLPRGCARARAAGRPALLELRIASE